MPLIQPAVVKPAHLTSLLGSWCLLPQVHAPVCGPCPVALFARTVPADPVSRFFPRRPVHVACAPADRRLLRLVLLPQRVIPRQQYVDPCVTFEPWALHSVAISWHKLQHDHRRRACPWNTRLSLVVTTPRCCTKSKPVHAVPHATDDRCFAITDNASWVRTCFSLDGSSRPATRFMFENIIIAAVVRRNKLRTVPVASTPIRRISRQLF